MEGTNDSVWISEALLKDLCTAVNGRCLLLSSQQSYETSAPHFLDWKEPLPWDKMPVWLFTICPDKHPSLRISFFVCVCVFRKLRRKLRRVLSWNIHEARKVKRSLKFRGRKNIHIYNPGQLFFFYVSSCVLGCFYLISPLITTPKWRVKSRNWRAAIPEWRFPPVQDACWYTAVVSGPCNVKQA